MRTVLITGGAGFIGSHLAKHFVSLGFRIKILDDFSSGRRDNLVHLASRVETHQGSIADQRLLKSVLEDVDIVVHNAAFLGVERVIRNPWKVLETNSGDLHAFFSEIIRSRVKKVVFASSSEVYDGSGTFPLKETAPLYLERPYPMSKRLGETYCRAINDQFGIDTCSLRYFNVYGPGQSARGGGFAVSTFFESIIERKPLVIFGSGRQTRDFTYVDDVVLANQLAVMKKTNGEVMNVGTGVETSINELAAKILRVTGGKVRIKHVAPRAYGVTRRVADIRRAERILKWKPKTGLDDGLAKVWEWFGTRSEGKSR